MRAGVFDGGVRSVATRDGSIFPPGGAPADDLEFGDAFGPIGMDGGAAALEEIEGLGGFGRFDGLSDFAEFAARVHTKLSEYSTGGLRRLAELASPEKLRKNSSLLPEECPSMCPAAGARCLKSGQERDSGGLECNQGRQITTQFERDARRGARRNRVGL